MSDESQYSVNMEMIGIEESPCDGISLVGAYLKEARFVASSLCGADLSHSLNSRRQTSRKTANWWKCSIFARRSSALAFQFGVLIAGF